MVGRAVRVELDFIRRAVVDVHVSAVALPSGIARGKVCVGKINAPEEFFFEGVRPAAGTGVPPLPELLDEPVALLVGGELFKSPALPGLDEVADRAVQPALIRIAFNDAG